MAHVNRKEYFVIFVVLAVLTALEIGVVKMPGIGRTLMVIALIGLAVTKAAIVGLFYMHLRYETRILKLTIAIPMATPAFYALVLIAEAAYRAIWRGLS
jgi:cytochrome c oxidase subunit 4